MWRDLWIIKYPYRIWPSSGTPILNYRPHTFHTIVLVFFQAPFATTVKEKNVSDMNVFWVGDRPGSSCVSNDWQCTFELGSLFWSSGGNKKFFTHRLKWWDYVGILALRPVDFSSFYCTASHWKNMKRPKVDGTSDARFTTGTIGITYHCWTLPSCFSCYVAELLQKGIYKNFIASRKVMKSHAQSFAYPAGFSMQLLEMFLT